MPIVIAVSDMLFDASGTQREIQGKQDYSLVFWYDNSESDQLIFLDLALLYSIMDEEFDFDYGDEMDALRDLESSKFNLKLAMTLI